MGDSSSDSVEFVGIGKSDRASSEAEDMDIDLETLSDVVEKYGDEVADETIAHLLNEDIQGIEKLIIDDDSLTDSDGKMFMEYVIEYLAMYLGQYTDIVPSSVLTVISKKAAEFEHIFSEELPSDIDEEENDSESSENASFEKIPFNAIAKEIFREKSERQLKDVKMFSRRYIRRLSKYINKRSSSKSHVGKTVDFKRLILLKGAINSLSIPSPFLPLPKANFRDFAAEYIRLIRFIKVHGTGAKNQLRNLAFPMFVVIYLVLLYHERPMDAKTFYEEYHGSFPDSKRFKKALQELSTLKEPADVLNHEYFRRFWSESVLIQISGETLEKLRSEMKTELKLLSVLFSIHFFVVPDASYRKLFKGIGIYSDVDEQDEESDDVEMSFSDERLENLKSVIEDVKGERLCSPITYVYNVKCAKKRLCAVDIDQVDNILAHGCGRSSIHLWSLNSLLFRHHKPKRKDRKKTNTKYRKSVPYGLWSHNHQLKGHNGAVLSLHFTPHSLCPSNKLLMSCSEDGTIRAWSMKNFTNVAMYSWTKSPYYDLDIAKGEPVFAVASKDYSALLFQFERPFPVRVFAGHYSNVNLVKFHPNGGYLATASDDLTIRLWNRYDHKAVRCFVGHKSDITALTFSSDGTFLASGDSSGNIMFWDLAAGLPFGEYSAHSKKGRILNLDFNKNDSVLASCSSDNFVKIWDARYLLQIKTPLHMQKTPKVYSKISRSRLGLINSAEIKGISHICFNHRDVLIVTAADTFTSTNNFDLF